MTVSIRCCTVVDFRSAQNPAVLIQYLCFAREYTPGSFATMASSSSLVYLRVNESIRSAVTADTMYRRRETTNGPFGHLVSCYSLVDQKKLLGSLI